ncbi:MAG: GNAT family N-acetyltransferase [Rhizomicrobium sp.]
MADEFLIAALNADATDKVVALYRAAAGGGGLARAPDEIDEAYVGKFLEAASRDGIGRAVFARDGTLIGEIHAQRMTPRQFRHVLTDLTVAVHPDWQGKGLGSLLFAQLIAAARETVPPITRIELFAREGNMGAIRPLSAHGLQDRGPVRGARPIAGRQDRGRHRDGFDITAEL